MHVPSSINGFPVVNLAGGFANLPNLKRVTIPDSVTNIGSFTFVDCQSLKNVTFGTGVTNIGLYAFDSCINLAAIYFQGNKPTYTQIFYNMPGPITGYHLAGTTGWSISAPVWDPAFPYTFTTNSGALTITKYIGPDNEVNIPDAFNGMPVTAIGGSAFGIFAYVTSVTIPNTVITIGQSAFANGFSDLGLTNVIIGTGVTNIGDSAFASCSSLASTISLPALLSLEIRYSTRAPV